MNDVSYQWRTFLLIRPYWRLTLKGLEQIVLDCQVWSPLELRASSCWPLLHCRYLSANIPKNKSIFLGSESTIGLICETMVATHNSDSRAELQDSNTTVREKGKGKERESGSSPDLTIWTPLISPVPLLLLSIRNHRYLAYEKHFHNCPVTHYPKASSEHPCHYPLCAFHILKIKIKTITPPFKIIFSEQWRSAVSILDHPWMNIDYFNKKMIIWKRNFGHIDRKWVEVRETEDSRFTDLSVQHTHTHTRR